MPARTQNGRFAPKTVGITNEQTGAQQPKGKGSSRELEASIAYSNMMYAAGGTPSNPMGFPGYLNGYIGNPMTYRWMLQNPIIRLVRSICIGVIASSTWEYEKLDPDAPDEAVELVQNQMNDLRDELVRDFFARGRDFGWYGGEMKWKTKKRRLVLHEVKPLLPELTDVMRDDFGNFVGLKNRAHLAGDPAKDIEVWAPFKAWKYTYDGEAGYPYGRSWLENVRETAWKDWLDTSQQLQKLGGKIVGMVTVITSPAGTFPGPAGADGKPTQVSYRKNAEDCITALASGAAGVWFPSLGLAADAKGSIDAMKVLADLAGKSMVNVDVKDFGSQAGAITGLLERLKHDEELIFAGGERSSRTGLQGQHGTKEEAGIHTDTGTLNAERDDRDFAKACRPLCNAITMANYGDRAEDWVRIKTPSLVDRRTMVLKSIILSILNDPDIASVATATLDVDRILASLGVPALKPFDSKEVIRLREAAATKAQQPRTKNPEPQGGRPPQG